MIVGIWYEVSRTRNNFLCFRWKNSSFLGASKRLKTQMLIYFIVHQRRQNVGKAFFIVGSFFHRRCVRTYPLGLIHSSPFSCWWMRKLFFVIFCPIPSSLKIIHQWCKQTKKRKAFYEENAQVIFYRFAIWETTSLGEKASLFRRELLKNDNKLFNVFNKIENMKKRSKISSSRLESKRI